jgi:2-succinyl-6-hydroxy-2,4-cyclohexadiene-1-carboxylate synthase
MPLIELDSEIQYYIEIAGSGTPLVLLHGFTGNTQTWQFVWQALSERYQVIAVDLPGHGQSFTPLAPEDTFIDTVAEDLYTILQQLGVSECHLAGYSMGGRLALYFALTYPPLVKSLLIESASPGLAAEAERVARREADEALALQLEGEGLDAFIQHWETLPLWASQAKLAPAVRAKIRQMRLQNSAQGLAHSLRGLGTGVQPSLWGKLPRLTMPTLLITGELDAKFTNLAQAMQGANSLIRHAIVPQVGHTVHVENPAAFVQLVMQHIG